MTDMRAALEAAFEQDEQETETTTATEQEEENGLQEEQGQETTEEVTEDENDASGEPSQLSADDSKNEKPNDSATASAKDNQKAETKAQEDKPGYKAPGTWKPAVREKWSELPREVQEQIIERERQIARGFMDVSKTRKEAEPIIEAIKPFQAMIAAQGSDAPTAIRNMMTTAAGLQMGTPVQKASIVRDIIRNYGIDIETLDRVLSDDPEVGQQNETMSQLQQMLDQRLQPVNQLLNQFQQQSQMMQQQVQQDVQGEIGQFAEQADFFEDVREDMGDLMEMATRRGKTMSLQEAYDIAIAARPDLQKIVQQRQQAQAAAEQQKTITRKKNAASSISGAPAGDGSDAKPDSLRSALEQAWNGEL